MSGGVGGTSGPVREQGRCALSWPVGVPDGETSPGQGAMLPALPLEITCEVICDFILCEPVRGKSSLQWQRRLAETPVQGFQRGSCPTRSEFEDTTRVKAQLRSRGATLPVKPPQVWQVSLQLASMREQLMPKIVREGACRARSFKAPPFSPCPRARNPHVH